jgi:hypothetical protein
MADKKAAKIVNVDRADGGGVIIGYSDDTTAIYSADQLSTLTPVNSDYPGLVDDAAEAEGDEEDEDEPSA